MKSWVWCAGYFSPQDTWKWVHTINMNKKCIHVSPSWVSPGVWILNFRKHRSAFLFHFSPSRLPARLWIQCGLACGRILPASCVCQPCSHLFPHLCSWAGRYTPVLLFMAVFRAISPTDQERETLEGRVIKSSLFFSSLCSVHVCRVETG